MANLSIGDFARSTLRVPDITPDASGAQLLNQVSRQTSRIADEALSKWQEAEVSAAASAGAAAGRQKNVTYRPGTNLTASAYNQAASKSLATSTKALTTSGMAELEEVYKLDPAQYQEKSSEYITNVVTRLKESGDEGMASMFEAQLTFDKQSAGYRISKAYTAKQVDQAKADNETLMHTLQVNTFHGSGAIFSADPEEQAIALSKFGVNKKIFDSSLHAVLPDGTPVYSAVAIQKRQEAFHSQFYVNAVQNWVSEADLTPKDLKAINNGSIKIDIPGAGSIKIVDEVGVDDYKTKVRNFTFTKMREKEAAEAKQRTLDKEIMQHNQDVNDIQLLDTLYTNGEMSVNEVMNGVASGKYSMTTAKSAIKMLDNPAEIADDPDLVADLKIKQILGMDITKEVQRNSNRISQKTYTDFKEAGVKKVQSMIKEDEKWIVREMVKKNQYGIEDPRTLRLASDTVDSYRQKVADGASPEKAFQEIRTTMDAIKDRSNQRLYNSVPKYSVIQNGKINPLASASTTIEAYKAGKISEEIYSIEMERLEELINERNDDNAK